MKVDVAGTKHVNENAVQETFFSSLLSCRQDEAPSLCEIAFTVDSKAS